MRRRVSALCASIYPFAAALVLLSASASAQAQSSAAYHPSATGRAAEQKGLAAANRADFNEARADFLAAREADPYWPENLYYLGLATSKLPGLELSAAAWFEAYLVLEPKSPRAAEIRSSIDRLVQTGRDHAAVLTGAMERMAGAFPPDELDARKAHDVLMNDELALLPLAHPDGGYVVGENGQYPQLPGDTSKAWAAAAWLVVKGEDKDSLAREFASWGRAELTSKILDKGDNGENWYDFIPELIEGGFLNEITTRSMFRPGDFLPQEKISLRIMCDGSIDFAAKYFVLNTTYQRQEAMYTIRACAVAAIHAPEPAPDIYGNKTLGINPELVSVMEFYIEDGNSKATWQLFEKMDLDVLKFHTPEFLNAAVEKLDGKPGSAEKFQSAKASLDFYRTFPHSAIAAAAAAAYFPPVDAYKAQKEEEESTPWATAGYPADFVRSLGPASHGPWFSPREAADLWENAAKNDLSGDWFEHYTSQLEALRAHTSPNAIDKAGDVFSASANAAKILLDGVTLVTAYQRSMVIYRPPAVPLPYTWKPAPMAAK